MTSNERKIINCLWETKEKTHIRLVAQKANLSSDYARLLCRSLARSGHIKFENDLAHLLKKGLNRFENNDPAAGELTAVVANVTLLTDEPAVVSPASDRSDVVQQSSPQEEENPAPEGRGSLNEIERQEEGASEDNDNDKPASSSDEELDQALSDLEPSSKKEEGEKIDEPEESKKIESIKEAEVQETVAIETKPADPEAEQARYGASNPALVASLETSEETAAIKKEEKREKEDVAKPSGSSGWSFKKIVNWFTEKK